MTTKKDTVLLCFNEDISDLIHCLRQEGVEDFKVEITNGKFEGKENITFIISYPSNKPVNLLYILKAVKRDGQESVMFKTNNVWSHINTNGKVIETHIGVNELTSKPYSGIESWTQTSRFEYIQLLTTK
jgi:hypothetical protein